MSGRNLDRYLAVLRTPREVQDAFEAGRLTLTVAARVANLPRPEQEEIAAAIAAGGLPSEVVGESLAQRTTVKASTSAAYRGLLRDLAAAVTSLEGKASDIDECELGDADQLQLLRKFRAVLKELVARERQVIDQRALDDLD